MHFRIVCIYVYILYKGVHVLMCVNYVCAYMHLPVHMCTKGHCQVFFCIFPTFIFLRVLTHTELGAHQLTRVAIKLWGVLLFSSLTDGVMSVPFTVFNTTGFNSFPVSFNCQLKIAQSYLKESQRIASFILVYVHACETF